MISMHKELFFWMKERHSIYTKKTAGKRKPWTKDVILQSYRFCNVYRELDTVTQWIAESWRSPFSSQPDLWFAMVAARLVNWPETLCELAPAIFAAGGVPKWNPDRFIKEMHKRKAAGHKVFSGAYIVSTNGRAMDKAEYLAAHVLTPLWDARAKVRPQEEDTLASLHARLMQFDGMGSFIAGQVVADIKYVAPLANADDWWTWAASGPGSRRGLNRVCRYDVTAPWKEKVWFGTMLGLKELIDPMVAKAGMPPIHMQDLQNCLCEFDKWMRTHHGEGTPRSTYPGV